MWPQIKHLIWDDKSIWEGILRGVKENLKIKIRFWWNTLHVTYSVLAYQCDHYLFSTAVLRGRFPQVINFKTSEKAKAAEFQ